MLYKKGRCKMNFVDSLIGFAIGDAVGVPVEFTSRETLKVNPTTDMEEYGTHYQPKGTWSDDTSMTIATVYSMIENNTIDYNDIMYKFREWMTTGKYTATGRCFDVGGTCSSAIYHFNGTNACECGLKEINSNGNGSLMRMLPIVYYCYYKKSNDNEIYNYVERLSSLTHGHAISVLGCYLYVKYMINLLNGMDKYDSYESLKNINLSFFDENTLNVYNHILKKDISKIKLRDIKSSGYILDTLEAVLWTILNTRNYKDSILVSVNMGDDTDTVGAITGSISGLIYGINSIPLEWLENLKKKDELLELSSIFERKLNEGEIK